MYKYYFGLNINVQTLIIFGDTLVLGLVYGRGGNSGGGDRWGSGAGRVREDEWEGGRGVRGRWRVPREGEG